MLTLYYRTDCPQALRIRIILAEKLLPFTRRVVSKSERPIEVVEESGGRPPVLVDGTFAVTNSTVIAEYLEETFAKPALRPFEARSRAAIRTATRRIDEELGPIVERSRAVTRGSTEHAWSEALAPWEHKLGNNGLLLGLELSLADVWLVSTVEHARTRGLGIPPHFRKLGLWHSRLRERTSVRAEHLVEPREEPRELVHT